MHHYAQPSYRVFNKADITDVRLIKICIEKWAFLLKDWVRKMREKLVMLLMKV